MMNDPMTHASMAGRPDLVPGIEFRGVSKRYGDSTSPLVVDQIDFTVPRGSLTTLLGPSGCGKTTTLRMIAGLETPTAGRIFIDGVEVTRLGPAERNVSMVFQSYALFPHMTVLENVRYGLDVSGLTRPEADQRARESLAGVGLEGFDQRLPSELSGGQQQRVAVARALVLRPAVLLFDEPLSNLDAQLRRTMRDEIRSLQQRLELTVVYVTHDQGEALAVSDQIIVMNRGKIAQSGSAREVYQQPADAFVAGFMGEALILDGEADRDGRVRVGDLVLEGLPGVAQSGTGVTHDESVSPTIREGCAASAIDGVPVRVAVRPQAWKVSDAPHRLGEGPHETAGLQGVVIHHAWLGSRVELTVKTAIGQIFVVSHEVDRHWRSGDVVTLSLGRQGIARLAG
jgi:iron(III) transport system ATP-binding protein